MRSQPSPTRSRTRGQCTATGPMPVMILRSGRWPWRTRRWRPSSVSLSAWQPSKAATSASTACASSARAPLRNTSVSGSAKVPGWQSGKTLVSVTAYHSFGGEVEASNTPTIRRLTPSCRHQLSPIAPARMLGVTLQSHEVQGPKDFEAAFVAIAQERPDALLVLQDAVTLQQRKEIVDFAIQKRLPGMFQAKGWAEAGGLMSYGEDLHYMYRRAAYFVDKIFKGANPADLPVEQATKFELVLNLKTAKAIGLTIPDTFLALADQVIE